MLSVASFWFAGLASGIAAGAARQGDVMDTPLSEQPDEPF
jgi:hypothetical protein